MNLAPEWRRMCGENDRLKQLLSRIINHPLVSVGIEDEENNDLRGMVVAARRVLDGESVETDN